MYTRRPLYMPTRLVKAMQVKCPACGDTFTLGLSPLEALQVERAIEANRRIEVAREMASGDVDMERIKRQRRVAKETRSACAELAKAREVAQNAISKNQEAAQQGVSISPALTTMLQSLVAKLIDAENYSGALS